MSSLGNQWENFVLDHILKVASLSSPDDIFIALSTADPTEDASGLAEPSNGAYVRQYCGTWDAAASRALENTNEVLFAQATANWGTITHFAIMSTVSNAASPYMIGYGAFTNSKEIQNGDQARIAVGECDVSITSTPSTGGMSDQYADKVLDHIFKNTSLAQPSGIYVALSTTTPTDSWTGTEPDTANAYDRIQHDTWGTAEDHGGGASENTGAITFTEATASWATITHVMLFDNITATTNSFMLYAPLDTARAIDSGDSPRFSDGDIDITVT